MQKLSVVISACNEEKNIGICLDSVSWADEIIVVDNNSTDRTVQIAKRRKATVYSRPNNPMLNVNKNYGFSKATGDWILNLDADESVDKELTKEIQNVLNREEVALGYEIARKNYIFGKWIKHTGWYPDYQLRLFRKGEGAFSEKHVHEKIVVNGYTEKLKGHIIHNNYRSVSHFLSKLDLYTDNEVQNLAGGGYVFNKMDVIDFPKREFLSRYFAQDGYKDGLHGLTLSLLMASYHLIVFAKLWEREKFKKYDLGAEKIDSIITGIIKETVHWIDKTVKRQSLKNRIKRFISYQ